MECHFLKLFFKSLIVRGHQFWETERFYFISENREMECHARQDSLGDLQPPAQAERPRQQTNF
jgi:hypothetical protein